jgi:low temperature requirement protein LtrA
MNAKPSLLRDRSRSDSAKVTMVELFFDLVFVFAVTQLSHTLLANLTLVGVLQVSLLLLAVWWVWIYTSWVTNWLDPDRVPVRLCLFVMMLAGLLLSVSIPRAFADRGLLLAGVYVFMQVGRTLFFLWAVRGAPRGMVRNFQRIAAWLILSGVFWIAGGLVAGSGWPCGRWRC